MRALLLFLLLAVNAGAAPAQFQILDTHTTADLRGIDSVGGGVAWASGSNGTVLRTEDGGYLWQGCATPPSAEHLDFRGVQAFDNNTALVLSSGPGDQSRLYETTDGCQTWKLVFSNPDPAGFWDALLITPVPHTIFILGDPVNGRFRLFSAAIDAATGHVQSFAEVPGASSLAAASGQSAFAASNSLFAATVDGSTPGFITGGSRSEVIYPGSDRSSLPPKSRRSGLPFAACESCGAFSIATASSPSGQKAHLRTSQIVVAVGGNYKAPTVVAGTAAFSTDGGRTFHSSRTGPHGYRSAVAFDPASRTWIAVGPTGADISRDGGRDWRALKPAPGEAPDADQHWNALSWPFAVGPRGRIGLLRESSLLAGRARGAARPNP